MKSEQGSDEDAAPDKTGGGAQEIKQKHDVECMKKETGGMMPGGMEGKELDVGHVGNPGERMPVGHDGGAEGPGNVVEGESRLKISVLRDVAGIIVIDKAVGEGGPIREESDGNQKKREEPRFSRVVVWR